MPGKVDRRASVGSRKSKRLNRNQEETDIFSQGKSLGGAGSVDESFTPENPPKWLNLPILDKFEPDEDMNSPQPISYKKVKQWQSIMHPRDWKAPKPDTDEGVAEDLKSQKSKSVAQTEADGAVVEEASLFPWFDTDVSFMPVALSQIEKIDEKWVTPAAREIGLG
jgi:hypothetical protein